MFYGLAADKAAARRTVLAAARARQPHRFSGTATPKFLDLPDTAWINHPADHTDNQQETEPEAA